MSMKKQKEQKIRFCALDTEFLDLQNLNTSNLLLDIVSESHKLDPKNEGGGSCFEDVVSNFDDYRAKLEAGEGFTRQITFDKAGQRHLEAQVLSKTIGRSDIEKVKEMNKQRKMGRHFS